MLNVMPNHCMRATHATAPTTPSASTDPANHPIRDHWRFLPAAPALAHLHNNTPLYKAAAMNKITCGGREMPRTGALGSGPLSDWCHALCHCASGSFTVKLQEPMLARASCSGVRWPWVLQTVDQWTFPIVLLCSMPMCKLFNMPVKKIVSSTVVLPDSCLT